MFTQSKLLSIIAFFAASQVAATGRDNLPTKSILDLQGIPGNVEQTSYLWRYHPDLVAIDGCDAFPAVDSFGVLSKGLEVGGYPDSGCASSVGQTYVRRLDPTDPRSKGMVAIMYAWFFPKSQTGVEGKSPVFGHKYAWYNVVVWISDRSFNAQDVRLSLVDDQGAYKFVDGHWPVVGTTHHATLEQHYKHIDMNLPLTQLAHPLRPLINYDTMPLAAKLALEQFDFGGIYAQKVPFVSPRFEINIENSGKGLIAK